MRRPRHTRHWRDLKRAVVRAPDGKKQQAQRDLRAFVHAALRAHVEGRVE